MENEINEGINSTIDEEVITDDIDFEEETPTEEETTEEAIEPEEKPEEVKPKLTREEKYAKAMAIAKRYAPKEQKQKAKAPETSNTDVAPVVVARVFNKIDNSKLPPELADEAFKRVERIAKIDAEDGEQPDLMAAYNSDEFKLWEEKQIKSYKAEKSQLRTSRGGKVQIKKTLDTPGLSEEEHKALWKEAMQ